ncbi:MAG: LysR family transcriptional regulator [Burkholderiaceae bacterium]
MPQAPAPQAPHPAAALPLPAPPFALSDASLFVATVEAGSFSAAAVGNALTASGVSKAVSRLERSLGVRLLVRSTRRLRLTDEGHLFFERCRDGLALMHQAGELATETSRQLKGVLRIGVPPTAGIHLMMPILNEFLHRHAELSVQLVQLQTLAEFYSLRADCAIVIGDVDDATLAGRPLGSSKLATVAAPAYLARRPAPRTLDEIAGHDCVTLTDLHGNERPWRFAAADGAVRELPVQGRIRTDIVHQVIAATLIGSGLAQIPAPLIASDLQRGTLVRLLPDWDADGPDVWVVYPAQRAMPRRVRAALDFLIEWTRSRPLPAHG